MGHLVLLRGYHHHTYVLRSYRRCITGAVTQLVIESDGYNRPEIVQAERPCGSWAVGLGALVHLGEEVTWPALRALVVAEAEAELEAEAHHGPFAPSTKVYSDGPLCSCGASLARAMSLAVGKYRYLTGIGADSTDVMGSVRRLKACIV